MTLLIAFPLQDIVFTLLIIAYLLFHYLSVA
jgi:hypothetical protein